MKKIITTIFILLVIALPSNGQKRDYNCVILDSIFSAIQWRKWHNDFLLPLFRSAEIETDGSFLHRVIDVKAKNRSIDSVITLLNVKARTWSFLEDTLFSLDKFNIIVDTFNFFNNSCSASKNGNYLIVNDYRVVDNFKKRCNVILVQAITYSSSGAITFFLKNTKSNFAVIFGIREGSKSPYPKISIIGRIWYDPVDGFSD